MTMSRCVGLLGGVGVGAATHYYRELARAAEARAMELDLVMVHADMLRALKFVEAGDRAGYARHWAAFFARMKAAGAEFAVIPSVTSHYCLRELQEITPLPLISLFDAVGAEVAARKLRRLAVFGTRFVIESDMFEFVPGAEFVRPRAEEIEYIHANYMRMAMDGFGTAVQYVGLRELAMRLIERERLDAVVLGGTDLALIFNEGNTDFPHLDCAAAHLRLIGERVFAG